MDNDHADDPMQILSRGVHQLAFFDRLSQRRLLPTTNAEADELLEFARKLRLTAAEDEPGLPGESATQPGHPPARASSDLNAQDCGDITREKAEQLAKDPAIYNAVLSLRETI